MKIISKIKDIYDYLVGIRGIDSFVVYDRREYSIFKPVYFSSIERQPTTFYALLIGKKVYIIAQKWITEKCLLKDVYGIPYKASLITSFSSELVINPSPCTLLEIVEWNMPSRLNFYDSNSYIEIINKTLQRGNFLENIILRSCPFIGVLDIKEIYDLIYNYLLEKTDNYKEIKASDMQKLEAKGFDKKTSFRHPIK